MKNAYYVSIGWIRHGSGAEISANSTYRVADLPKYELGVVKGGRNGKNAGF